jgi:hypothetical protein
LHLRELTSGSYGYVLALWLMPHAVGMQPRPSILGSLITGEEQKMRLGDMQDTLEKHISALLCPLTNHEGEHEPPHRPKAPQTHVSPEGSA